jgi:8-oxo-dGTP diphosphatase
MDFIGSKAAFFHDGALLCYLRDAHDGLAWPEMWDLPGGGREGNETPEACLLRELHEEFGLTLPPQRLIWRQGFPAMRDPKRLSYFFAGHLSADDIQAIKFGSEGQHWQMMRVEEFLAHPRAIPDLQHRVAAALAAI